MSKQNPAKSPKTRLSLPVNPSAPGQNAAGRRAVLRGLGGGALFAAVIERLPGSWQRPVVSAAALPAHAQTSPNMDIHPATTPSLAFNTYSGAPSAFRAAPLHTVHTPPRAFIFTWEIKEGELSITIPATGVGYHTRNYTVLWGDGQITSNETGQATHTYSAPGIYTVQVTGELAWVRQFPHNLRSIEQWGTMHWGGMQQTFQNIQNLKINAPDRPDLSGVDSMAQMFSGASFTGDISNWDVSNILDMTGMFMFYSGPLPDIRNWDIRNVSSMLSMFLRYRDYEGPVLAQTPTMLY